MKRDPRARSPLGPLFEEAKERRDVGMGRAVTHADREQPEWSATALVFLREFVHKRDGTFLAEDFIAWADGRLALPPDARAFGAVIFRAAKLGLIQKVGYAPAKSSNLSPKCLWRAA